MRHVAIRLDDPRYKRLRMAVARHGTTIQKAVEYGVDRYLEEVETVSVKDEPEDLRGFLRDTKVMAIMKRERREELKRERRRT
jgi:hypothetical protein